ncbi:MAG TPA: DUF1667 domain-containing protein [Tissierellales bacterium]|nr:DUF1667 domain-containing protein [Tissierellales bacterium]
MKTIKKTCIRCPIGCRLTITKDDTLPSGYLVEGNTCNRGEEYAIKEMTNPSRTVTSTVKIKNSTIPRLPIKTKGEIPKDKIFECMDIINSIEVSAPIKKGDIILKNVLDTNIDIIATRSA